MRSCRWSGRGGAAAVGACALVLACAAPARAAITFGQVDTYEDGSTMGWHQGANPNSPTNVETGGPQGDGDHFLQNASLGGERAGGKMVMLNEQQWAGDYAAAGVTRLDASLANFGETTLFIRAAVMSGTAVFASTQAVELPAHSGWRRVTFGLTSDALSKVEGVPTATLADALTHVMTLRLLSREDAPEYHGDPVAGVLGLDDLRALRLPGDANFDGRVDAADLVTARLNLGNPGPHTWREGDFDFDGRVTSRDMLLVRRNLGASLPPAGGAAFGPSLLLVPEPGCGALLLLGSSLLLRRRR